MWDHNETYFVKTALLNVANFKSRINEHISKYRTRTFTDKFPRHVYHGATKNKYLKEPFFNEI